MTDLSPDARALFEKAKTAIDPSEARLDRVRAGIAARTAPMPPDGGGSPGAPTSGGGRASHTGLKAAAWAGGAFLAAGVLVLAWPRGVERPMPLPTTGEAPMASALGPSAEPESPPPAATTSSDLPSSTAPIPTARATVLRSGPRPAVAHSVPVESDTLAEETALLAKARNALTGGNAPGALTLLDAYNASYPRGLLGQEQLATRALALCAVGRTADARAVAARLEREAPHSPHLTRLHASCAAAPPSVAEHGVDE